MFFLDISVSVFPFKGAYQCVLNDILLLCSDIAGILLPGVTLE